MKKSIVASSGNVFVDLGYSQDEAAILQMRADLMTDIRKFIKAKNLPRPRRQIFLASVNRVYPI